MITELERRIINLIQGDLPVASRPFAVLADQLGIPESTLLGEIRKLKERGVIRRFGATLRHQEAGFSSNAMIVWRVPEERLEDVGKLIAGFKEVTHCYQRKLQRGWPYNLYSMVHGNNREDCHEIAQRLSQKVGISEYTLLFSQKEFKKTSMEYF
jgi:siroheme decarboxylase